MLSSAGIVSEALANPNISSEKENTKAEPKTYTYPEFDLSKIPFSYIGSYHTVNKPGIALVSRLVINTVRRSAIPYKWLTSWTHNLLEIALLKDGKEINFETRATPWSVELTSKDSSATIVFADKDSLLVQTRNCSLNILPFRNFSWKYEPARAKYVFYDADPNHYYYLQSYDKSEIKLTQVSPYRENGVTDSIACAEQTQNTVLLKMVTEEENFNPVLRNFDDLLRARMDEIEIWMKKAPKAKKEHQAAVYTGWYLFWNLQVSPWGNYTRQSVLSSKKSMNMMWSWDICFNALALVKADHSLAWGQLFAVLDKQKENGLLPDTVSDLQNGFGFNKPPVWGWTVMKMLENTPKTAWDKYIGEAYPKIAKFTHWWLNNRNLGGQGICAYMHGNDSGWDNASIFDDHQPVESPDLTAFLIKQAEALAFMAAHLHKPKEAGEWLIIAEQQLKLFNTTFIIDNHFIYRTLTHNGPQVHESGCLLTRIPLVLGSKLSLQVKQTVINELKQEGVFLTTKGIASEALTSPKYEPNGYWRGPVWAPSTYLIFDGLLKCGEKELARKIAQRFCDMVSEKSTFNENYNAITGEGQYDSGLTWTASDFLLMAECFQKTVSRQNCLLIFLKI